MIHKTVHWGRSESGHSYETISQNPPGHISVTNLKLMGTILSKNTFQVFCCEKLVVWLGRFCSSKNFKYFSHNLQVLTFTMSYSCKPHLWYKSVETKRQWDHPLSLTHTHQNHHATSMWSILCWTRTWVSWSITDQTTSGSICCIVVLQEANAPSLRKFLNLHLQDPSKGA